MALNVWQGSGDQVRTMQIVQHVQVNVGNETYKQKYHVALGYKGKEDALEPSNPPSNPAQNMPHVAHVRQDRLCNLRSP